MQFNVLEVGHPLGECVLACAEAAEIHLSLAEVPHTFLKRSSPVVDAPAVRGAFAFPDPLAENFPEGGRVDEPIEPPACEADIDDGFGTQVRRDS